jgi:hypothetical protein
VRNDEDGLCWTLGIVQEERTSEVRCAERERTLRGAYGQRCYGDIVALIEGSLAWLCSTVESNSMRGESYEIYFVPRGHDAKTRRSSTLECQGRTEWFGEPNASDSICVKGNP